MSLFFTLKTKISFLFLFFVLVISFLLVIRYSFRQSNQKDNITDKSYSIVDNQNDHSLTSKCFDQTENKKTFLFIYLIYLFLDFLLCLTIIFYRLSGDIIDYFFRFRLSFISDSLFLLFWRIIFFFVFLLCFSFVPENNFLFNFSQLFYEIVTLPKIFFFTLSFVLEKFFSLLMIHRKIVLNYKKNAQIRKYFRIEEDNYFSIYTVNVPDIYRNKLSLEKYERGNKIYFDQLFQKLGISQFFYNNYIEMTHNDDQVTTINP